jgi:hypothetical protein
MAVTASAVSIQRFDAPLAAAARSSARAPLKMLNIA